jgi:hypothetical protein
VTFHVPLGRGGEGRLIYSETTLEDYSAHQRSTSQTKKGPKSSFVPTTEKCRPIIKSLEKEPGRCDVTCSNVESEVVVRPRVNCLHELAIGIVGT